MSNEQAGFLMTNVISKGYLEQETQAFCPALLSGTLEKPSFDIKCIDAVSCE